jgi:hypothetical protein
MVTAVAEAQGKGGASKNEVRRWQRGGGDDDDASGNLPGASEPSPSLSTSSQPSRLLLVDPSLRPPLPSLTALSPLPLDEPTPKKTKKQMHLHEVGSRVLCRASFDGEMHPATIVERRGGAPAAAGPSSSSSAAAFEVPLAYYVHYAHCDKRLDEWVAPGRIAPVLAGGGGGGRGGGAAAAAAAANGGAGAGGARGAGASNGGGVGASNGAGPSNGTSAAAGTTAAAAAAAAGTTGPGPSGAASAAAAAAAAAPHAAPSSTAAVAALAQQTKMTRRLKRVYDQTHHVSPTLDELPPLDAAAERAHQEKTRLKNIQSVELGRFEVDAWYFSPYPEPFCSLPKLHLCEFCLKYFAKRSTLVRHAAKCDARHPPGDEIYRSPPPAAAGRGDAPASAVADPPVAVFEVDGKKDKVYCQSLCLLSKLFLVR